MSNQHRDNYGRNLAEIFGYDQNLRALHQNLDEQLNKTDLFQNEWGCLYAFINTKPTSHPQLFFIDEPDFVDAFSQQHANVLLNKKNQNDMYKNTFEARLKSAIYKLDIAYLSPKVFQKDSKNLFIKINADQCMWIGARFNNYQDKSDTATFKTEMMTLNSPIIRLLPSSKIFTIYKQLESYIYLLTNKEKFIDQALLNDRSFYTRYQNHSNDHEQNKNHAINELIERTCQGRPDHIILERITGFFDKFNIHKDYHPCLLTWIAHALMPSAHQIALQIIGPRDSGKSSLQRFLKAVIDPDSEDDLEIPKTSKSLHKDAFQNHLLSYDEVDEFKTVVEKDMDKILQGTHINVDHLYKKGQQKKTVKVRRPIIWNSLNNIVTNPKLQERVLTITLPDNKFCDESFKIDSYDVAYCTAYAILAICDAIHGFKTAPIHNQLRYPPAFEDFIKIGNTILNGSGADNSFSALEDGLNKLFLTQAKLAIASSVVGDALLTFISTHDKKDYTFKMIEWSEKLESCKANGVKWFSEPNKVGAELDKLTYLLMNLGIEIYQSNEQGERLEPGTIRSNYFRTLTFLEHQPPSPNSPPQKS